MNDAIPTITIERETVDGYVADLEKAERGILDELALTSGNDAQFLAVLRRVHTVVLSLRDHCELADKGGES